VNIILIALCLDSLEERMIAANAAELWKRIETRLTLGLGAAEWRQRIEALNQVPAVRARAQGRKWSDDEVFKGLVLSVLSNNTDWAKVERFLPRLGSIFHEFQIHHYASLAPDDIAETLVPWFQEHRAGSQTLGNSLRNLICAATELLKLAEQHSSLEKYFDELQMQNSGDARLVAIALGGASSPHKLPGLGVPLAAEFLKNIGYDTAKPDRHINRAAGSFG